MTIGASQDRAVFSAWLNVMASHAGASGPVELQRVLIQHECHCTTEAVASWLEGTSVPPPAKIRETMIALNKAVPDVDAFDEYRRIARGEEPPEARKKAELEGAGKLLDELIQQDPRLPPRLT